MLFDYTKEIIIRRAELNADEKIPCKNHDDIEDAEYVGYLRHSDSTIFYCPRCDVNIRVDWTVGGTTKREK